MNYLELLLQAIALRTFTKLFVQVTPSSVTSAAQREEIS